MAHHADASGYSLQTISSSPIIALAVALRSFPIMFALSNVNHIAASKILDSHMFINASLAVSVNSRLAFRSEQDRHRLGHLSTNYNVEL